MQFQRALWKVFRRSGLLKDHLITCDAGVLDADFRGIVWVIMINHHPEKTFTITTGDRIAQYVFMKKYNVEFQKVSGMAMSSITKRGRDGFGSTSGIRKVLKLDDSDSENNENQMLILPTHLPPTPPPPPQKKVISQADWDEIVKKVAAAQDDELEIVQGRTTMMTDDDKIIIDEKI